MRRVIGAAYNAAEYGAGFDQLSSISFLRFVHGDKRGKCAQVGSANRIAGGDGFNVVDGNDRIATGLAERLPMPVQLGHKQAEDLCGDGPVAPPRTQTFVDGPVASSAAVSSEADAGLAASRAWRLRASFSSFSFFFAISRCRFSNE